MNNEIKEIIDKLQRVANRETASYNALIEMKDTDYRLLLDYITNLQEENERLNNIIDELEKMLIEYFKDEFPREVDEILNKVQELKGDSSNE